MCFVTSHKAPQCSYDTYINTCTFVCTFQWSFYRPLGDRPGYLKLCSWLKQAAQCPYKTCETQVLMHAHPSGCTTGLMATNKICQILILVTTATLVSL